MERERIYRNSVARTIRPQRGGEGAMAFADNRPAGILQAAAGPVQRLGEEEEETLQGKFEAPVQRKNETGMPDNLKAGIEELSGFSMDGVRVHYNSERPAAIQALAYTQGTEIHVAPGEERHLPHEAWHVAQQLAGRVEPTAEVGGLPVNDSPELEREADAMGAKANSYRPL